MELFKKKVSADQLPENIRRKKVTKIAGFVVLGFFAFIILMVIIAPPSDLTPRSDLGPATANPVSAPSLSIGDTAYISWPNGAPALLGTTKENMDEVLKSLVAKDPEGGAKMLLSGRALLVPNGTMVRIIDAGFASKQLRILEGEYYGEAVWAPSEFVIRNKP